MNDCKPAADVRYIRPQRANELMKKAQSIRQTVYINGACGCGKTAFAEDFLSKMKYEYYSMADARLTADVCPLQDGTGRIIVIDDLHELQSADERQAAYDVLSYLARSADCWLILISRSQVPAWLMPLYVECIFVTIGERELCLTDEEGRAYFAKWNLTLRRDTEESVLLEAQGFPLALRIVALQFSILPGTYETELARKTAEKAAADKARYNIYDYLETHVYDQWDVELAEFLMDISIVEQFDIPMAQLITKKNNAGVLIRRACETGTFLIERRQGEKVSYEMRKPMRKSMRRRLAGCCTKTHIDGLYRSAGEGYELAGDVANALAMYEKCGYEEGISRILVENARQHAGSGHYWELRKYYLALPEDMIRESPELMAGMSLLASIMLNDEESERWYQELSEYAKRQTGSTKKAAQARLLYLDIALPQRGTGQMTDVLRHAWTFITERKTILPEMSLTNNQPTMMHGGKDFCEWSRRDRELAKKIGKPVEILMGSFGNGLVNLALAESFLEKGGDSYEVSVLAQKGRMQAQAGGAPEQEFVGVGLLAWLSVLTGRMDDALSELEAFRENASAKTPWLLPGIDTLLVRLYLYTGNKDKIEQWMAQAPDEGTGFCTLERYRYVAKVRVYLAVGKTEKAFRLLSQLLVYAQKRERTWLVMEAKILLAITQYRMNDEKWRDTLQEAVTQAEDYHFVRILTREGAAIRDLLRTGDLTWKDKSFRTQVKKECEQMASHYPAYLDEEQAGVVRLSDKALEILRLQAQGKTLQQISQELGLSKEGVRYYNRSTYRKLGASGKAEALIKAKDKGIL